jgi:hypothetical protein
VVFRRWERRVRTNKFTKSCDFPIRAPLVSSTSNYTPPKNSNPHCCTSTAPLNATITHAQHASPSAYRGSPKECAFFQRSSFRNRQLTTHRLRRSRRRPRRMPRERLPLEGHRKLHRRQIQSKHVPARPETRAHTAESRGGEGEAREDREGVEGAG